MPEREYWMIPLHESQPKDTFGRLLQKTAGLTIDILMVDGGYEKVYVITEDTTPEQEDVLKKALIDA